MRYIRRRSWLALTDAIGSNNMDTTGKFALVPRTSAISKQEHHFENAKLVADFLFRHAVSDQIEIEAKLGRIVSKRSRERITSVMIPVRSQAILDSNASDDLCRFEAGVSQPLFMEVAKMIDEIDDVDVKDTEIVDSIYQNNIRVSKDTETGEETVMSKIRLEDMNVYEPTGVVDFRISASKETVLGDLGKKADLGALHHERKKSRRSFVVPSHPLFRFDVTRVSSNEATAVDAPTFEVEVEIIGMKTVVEERQKAASGEPNALLLIAQSFMNQMRGLVHVVTRKATTSIGKQPIAPPPSSSSSSSSDEPSAKRSR
eukprot:ANDGO_04021.mRNA.1 mRNA-capping enzyme subunit beta